jgi:hypothetical protein
MIRLMAAPQLLLQSKEVPSSLLPNEALAAICGIFAMLGQRSHGAASAIVQHPTLHGDLLELTLEARDNSPRGSTNCACCRDSTFYASASVACHRCWT